MKVIIVLAVLAASPAGAEMSFVDCVKTLDATKDDKIGINTILDAQSIILPDPAAAAAKKARDDVDAALAAYLVILEATCKAAY